MAFSVNEKHTSLVNHALQIGRQFGKLLLTDQGKWSGSALGVGRQCIIVADDRLTRR